MTLSDGEIGALIAAIARTGGLTVTAPVIGDLGVALRARLMFVLGVGIAIGVNRPPVALADAPLIAIIELAVGLVTGLTARMVMARLAVAGQLMGLSLGLGFAAQYDVHAGESAGVIRTMITTLGSLAFLAAGGVHAVVRSAAAAPAEISQLSALAPAFVHHAASAFAHGLSLAAPIMLAALAGNIALAVMNRAAPAINVFSISLSAVLVLGGVVLLATAAHLVAGATDTARTAIDALGG